MSKTRSGVGHPRLGADLSLFPPSLRSHEGQRHAGHSGSDRLICSAVRAGGTRDEPEEDSEVIKRTKAVLRACGVKKREKRGENKIRGGKWFTVLYGLYVGGWSWSGKTSAAIDCLRHNKNSADMVQ